MNHAKGIKMKKNYYDQLTLEAKIKAQQEAAELPEEQIDSTKQGALVVIEDLFPHADAIKILQSIELKMQTFRAIGTQYKADIETGSPQYKDILLIAMGEILIELKPYEIVLRYMYPHMNAFFNTLSVWYMEYVTGSVPDATLGRA